jgi:glucokinase
MVAAALETEPQVIALDLGGTKLAAGLVSRSGAVRGKKDHETEQSGQDALLEQIESVIEPLVGDGVVALGVGIPSLIDQRRGSVGSSVNVPLAGVDLRARLHDRFGLPVAIENDANAAAVAEHRLGAGRGTEHMVLLTLGTGIGGGLILNGQLYRGSIGSAAELGHMVIDRNGGPCQGFCPGFGHFELYASGNAAGRAAQAAAEANPDGAFGRAAAEGRKLKGRIVVELAEAGEEEAVEILRELGESLGIGIASYVNIFNPELVVIGGGFSAAGDFILEPARRVVAEQALPTSRDVVRIVPAELGPEAGLVGSGLVGFDVADAG